MAVQVANPAIFGMACTYAATDLRPFVLSLRATGYEDTVKLGIDPDQGAGNLLRKWHVDTDASPCTDQADAEVKKLGGNTYLGNLNQRRWQYYKQWLIEGKHDRVWLLDVRDVIFQAHPFRDIQPSNEITFFVSKPASTTPVFTNIKRCFSDEDAAEMKASKMPTLEAGLVEGKASQIVPLCTRMVKSAQVASKKDEGCSLSDQYLLNHYVWENDLTKPGQVVFPGMTIAERSGKNSSALALSQAECAAEGVRHWKYNDSDGNITGNITIAGQAVPIIHGWDKCPDYKKRVVTLYRPPKKDLKTIAGGPSATDVKGRVIALYESQKQAVLASAGLLALILAYISYRVCRACARPNEYAPVVNEDEEDPLPHLENKRSDDDWEAAGPGELYTGATARIKGRAELNGKSCTIVRADPSRADVWVVRTENGELHALRTSNLVLKAGQRGTKNSAAPMPIGWTNNESDSDCN